MGLKICTDCGNEMSTAAWSCPHCNSTQVDWARERKWAIKALFVIFGLVAIFCIILSFISTSPR
jgi:ribosomal protein L40E